MKGLLIVIVLVLAGTLFLINALYEGGFKVLFSKRKYYGGRKIDLSIFFILSLICYVSAVFANKRFGVFSLNTLYTIETIIILAAFCILEFVPKKHTKDYE